MGIRVLGHWGIQAGENASGKNYPDHASPNASMP